MKLASGDFASAACDLSATSPLSLEDSPAGRAEATSQIADTKPGSLAAVLKELRSAENEVLSLRAQLEATQSQLTLALDRAAALAASKGVAVTIVDAGLGHARRLAAIKAAGVFLWISAFTFDLEDVVQSLIALKRRMKTIDIRVLIDKDQALTGPTRNLRPRVLQLTGRNIPVRLYSRTRLHSKVLLADSEQIWSSANWTDASLRNVERGVALKLSAEELAVEKVWFEGLWGDSRPFSGREMEDALITPERSGSSVRRDLEAS